MSHENLVFSSKQPVFYIDCKHLSTVCIPQKQHPEAPRSHL